MHHPSDRITHTTAFVTPVVEHWLDQEIAPSVHHEGSILLRCVCVCVCAIFNLSLFVMNTTIHCTLLPSYLATANMVLRMGLQGVGTLKIVLA